MPYAVQGPNADPLDQLFSDLSNMQIPSGMQSLLTDAAQQLLNGNDQQAISDLQQAAQMAQASGNTQLAAELNAAIQYLQNSASNAGQQTPQTNSSQSAQGGGPSTQGGQSSPVQGSGPSDGSNPQSGLSPQDLEQLLSFLQNNTTGNADSTDAKHWIKHGAQLLSAMHPGAYSTNTQNNPSGAGKYSANATT